MTDTRERSTPPPKPPRALTLHSVLETYLPAFILALGTGIALPAVPPLAESFDVSFAVASSIVTAFLVGGVVGAIPAGWLVDRFGPRSLLIAGPLLTSATALAVVFAQSFPELVACRFLGGVAAQMWVMARLATISRDAPPDQRGRQVSWMFGMDNAGKISGPLLGGVLAGAWGLRAPFVAYSVLALIALVPAFLATRDERRTDRPQERSGSATTPGFTKVSLGQIILPYLPYFGIALFAGLTRGPVFADLLHLYAAFAYDLGPRGIGYLATGAALIVLPIGFLAGWIMDYYGRRRTMIPGFISVTVMMAMLSVSAFAGFSLTAYVVLFLLTVASQGLTGGSVQTVGADVAPPGVRGRFLGLWRFTGQAGQATSPIVFALLASQVHYGVSFLFCALTAATVVYLVWRHVPKKDAPFSPASDDPGPLQPGATH